MAPPGFLLFGSAVAGGYFPEQSDIDIYFEGLSYDDECFVTGKTFLDFVDLKLDLIAAGHAPDTLKQEILLTGVAL